METEEVLLWISSSMFWWSQNDLVLKPEEVEESRLRKEAAQEKIHSLTATSFILHREF